LIIKLSSKDKTEEKIITKRKHYMKKSLVKNNLFFIFF